MRSTHDFLSDSSQSELLFLTTVVKDMVSGDPQALQRANKLIDALVDFMQREKLTLQYASDNQHNQRLLDLLITAAVEDAIQLEQFNESLAKWASDYRVFLANDTAAVRAKHAAQPPGILRTLLSGKPANNIFGDDYDARLVLKEVLIRNAAEVQPGRFNVLAPISLDTPGQLRDVMADILKGNEDKSFGLLLLANCGQSHWRVVMTEVQDGKVKNALLWDPMSGSASQLRKTKYYENLQLAINQINEDESVEPRVSMAGLQRNGHSCMDRGVQKILQLAAVANDITAVQSDDDLREAIEAAVCVNHAELLAESEESQEDESDSESVASVEEVEEVNPLAALDSASDDFEDQLHDLLAKREQHAEQIQFDEDMAKKLQAELDKLTEHDSKAAENPLFDGARVYAYNEMLARFGVMAKPASSVPVAASIPAASAKPVK